MKRGRPTIYDPVIADEICARIAAGEALYRICEADGMPAYPTVIAWALTDSPSRPGFYDKYARAREVQAYRMAEEINEIGDDSKEDWTDTKNGPVLNSEHVQRSRLRCDNRKWLLSKLLPKQFGERPAETVLQFNYLLEGRTETQTVVDWQQRAQLAIARPAGNGDD